MMANQQKCDSFIEMDTQHTEKSSEGHLHIITQAIREIALIFEQLGFSVVSGPELEKEFYNFDALNIPPHHPARDMQDTFWVKTKKGESRELLRTHTSSVQSRFLESIKENPHPCKIIVPGKVYRNEATDATHEAQFYQVEGLYVNKMTSMSELKGVLEAFFKAFLGNDAKIRFRPSYFGFVEPGVEVDVWWNNRWLEIFGGGIVHPQVFTSVGIDPKQWSGFAFGGGVERMIMIRYGIDDIRRLFSGDIRFLNQF